MISPINTKWTPERVERLKELAGKGETCKAIAAEFGMTRNAVIGKIHRLGLTWKGALDRGNGGRPPRNGAAPKRSVDRFMFMRPSTLMPASVVAPKTSVVEVVKPSRPCTLVNLRADSCRWPMWDDIATAEKHLYCNEWAVDGLPYCQGHCRIAYRPVERQRSAA